MKKASEKIIINEPYIDTDVYENARKTLVPLTGTDIDCILEGINNYLMSIAEQQIKLAFEQAQKERDDLSERTRQGLQTARLNGKQLGRAKGAVVITKKSDESKKKILKYSKTFGGELSDRDLIKLLEIDKLAVCGKNKEVSDKLKRWLRKKEKEPRIAGKSICFFDKDSDEYYYTRDLMYKPYNIEDALYCYKRWKNYILSKNGMVNAGYQVTEGEVVPGGSNKTGSHTVERKVDFSKRKSVTFVNPDIYGNY